MNPKASATGAMRQIIWTPGVSLESLIQQGIEAAFSFYKENKTATANALGISIRTLDNKLASYAKQKEEHAKRNEERIKARQDFAARQRGIPRGASYDNSASPTDYQSDRYKGVPRPATDGVEAGEGIRSESVAGAPAK